MYCFVEREFCWFCLLFISFLGGDGLLLGVEGRNPSLGGRPPNPLSGDGCVPRHPLQSRWIVLVEGVGLMVMRGVGLCSGRDCRGNG